MKKQTIYKYYWSDKDGDHVEYNRNITCSRRAIDKKEKDGIKCSLLYPVEFSLTQAQVAGLLNQEAQTWSK